MLDGLGSDSCILSGCEAEDPVVSLERGRDDEDARLLEDEGEGEEDLLLPPLEVPDCPPLLPPPRPRSRSEPPLLPRWRSSWRTGVEGSLNRRSWSSPDPLLSPPRRESSRSPDLLSSLLLSRLSLRSSRLSSLFPSLLTSPDPRESRVDEEEDCCLNAAAAVSLIEDALRDD